MNDVLDPPDQCTPRPTAPRTARVPFRDVALALEAMGECAHPVTDGG